MSTLSAMTRALPDADVSLSPRRIPVQKRSKKRVAWILQATRELLIETGLEAMSCEAIAARANVPVGTVYQFFPNKFAIICELDRLDTEVVGIELDSYASSVPTPHWQNLLSALIDRLAHGWRADPSRRAVWLSMQATPAMRQQAVENQGILANLVEKYVALLLPNVRRDQQSIIARVVVHVLYSMLNFSVRDGEAHPATIRETQRLLTAYLRATAYEFNEVEQSP